MKNFFKKHSRILVTGGAGFIGSAFIRTIYSNQNIEILNIDKLTYAGNLSSLPEIQDNQSYTFLRGDICDSALIDSIISEFKPNLIVHFAAESHVDNSIDFPEQFLQTNIFGTFNLLNASRKMLANNKNQEFLFYHISTDEVFGDLSLSDLPFTEESNYYPSSPYSASKASSDHLVRAWGRTYAIDYIISNCSNNYGPYQYPEKLIPNTIIKAIHRERIPVYGSGEQIRDWLHVDDHIDAIISIINSGYTNTNFNIGSQNEIMNIDIVTKICDFMNKHINDGFNYLSLIGFVKDRPGHDFRYAINPLKLKTQIGWNSSKNFTVKLEETILWYLENEDWWKALLNNKD